MLQKHAAYLLPAAGACLSVSAGQRGSSVRGWGEAGVARDRASWSNEGVDPEQIRGQTGRNAGDKLGYRVPIAAACTRRRVI